MKIDRQMIYNKCGGHCGYCGKEINFKEMQVDHIEPQWRGVNNDIENLLPTCRSCNHYKRGDILEQFRIKMKTLHERVCAHYIGKVGVNFGIVAITPFDGVFYFEKQPNQDTKNK